MTRSEIIDAHHNEQGRGARVCVGKDLLDRN